MRAGPVTCLCLSDDQLILSGSSVGSITVSVVLSDQRVATLRSRITTGGILILLGQKSLFGHVYICLASFWILWNLLI
jgi:hypothetical protein